MGANALWMSAVDTNDGEMPLASANFASFATILVRFGVIGFARTSASGRFESKTCRSFVCSETLTPPREPLVPQSINWCGPLKMTKPKLFQSTLRAIIRFSCLSFTMIYSLLFLRGVASAIRTFVLPASPLVSASVLSQASPVSPESGLQFPFGVRAEDEERVLAAGHQEWWRRPARCGAVGCDGHSRNGILSPCVLCPSENSPLVGSILTACDGLAGCWGVVKTR